MKIGQRRLNVGKQETNGKENTSGSTTPSIYPRVWNSTTSGTIAQVVLITLLLSLSQGMRIEFGSRNEKDDDK